MLPLFGIACTAKAKKLQQNPNSHCCHSCLVSGTLVAAVFLVHVTRGDPFEVTLLPLVLKSSTRMISLRRCGGDLLSTLCTERRSVDHTSSTKQKITLVEGRSSWTTFCAHLGRNTQRQTFQLGSHSSGRGTRCRGVDSHLGPGVWDGAVHWDLVTQVNVKIALIPSLPHLGIFVAGNQRGLAELTHSVGISGSQSHIQ